MVFPQVITDLQAKSLALYEKAKDILGNGEASQEQIQQADGWINESIEISGRVKSMLAAKAQQDEINVFLNEPVRGELVDEKDAGRFNGDVLETELKAARNGMVKYLRSANDFQFRNSCTPDELKTMSRLTDPAGGFFVNPEFSSKIITRLRDLVHIRAYADVYTISSAQLIIPVWDRTYTNPAVAEGGTISVQTGDTAGQKKLTPTKRATVLKITQELLEDAAFDVEAKLIQMVTEQIAEIEEPLFIEGVGTGQPMGILNGGITNKDIATITSGTIIPNDIQGLPFELKAAYRRGGRWLIPRSVLATIMKLRTNDDGANTGNYLWNSNFQTGQPPTLSGYPVLETEFMTAASVDGDALLAFGDLSKYAIADRMQLTIQKLIETYAINGFVGLLFSKRMDAGVMDVNAFVRLNRT